MTYGNDPKENSAAMIRWRVSVSPTCAVRNHRCPTGHGRGVANELGGDGRVARARPLADKALVRGILSRRAGEQQNGDGAGRRRSWQSGLDGLEAAGMGNVSQTHRSALLYAPLSISDALA